MARLFCPLLAALDWQDHNLYDCSNSVRIYNLLEYIIRKRAFNKTYLRAYGCSQESVLGPLMYLIYLEGVVLT